MKKEVDTQLLRVVLYSRSKTYTPCKSITVKPRLFGLDIVWFEQG